MMMFLRRKKLGAGSIRGVTSWFNSSEPRSVTIRIYKQSALGVPSIAVLRNDMLLTTRGKRLQEDCHLLIRWGCTSRTQVPIEKQLNISSAIQLVNDKVAMRKVLQENAPQTIPSTVFPSPNSGSTSTHLSQGAQVVLRPRHHAQGRNLFVTTTAGVQALVGSRPDLFNNGWYASEYIPKVAEFRVYVGSGRVITVAEKTPDNPDAVAWNVAQGGRFDVVRWGQWNMEACRVALEAFKYSGLDFSGVDVMIGPDGRAYVIELNSAPSLPLLSDGSRSYRQTVMAKYFKYVYDNGKEHFPECQQFNSWHDVIHPAIGE